MQNPGVQLKKKTLGMTVEKLNPVAAFSHHLYPNELLLAAPPLENVLVFYHAKLWLLHL